MIQEDRIQLNDRFIKVFKLLQDRGDVILNDRHGRGMGDFAQKILGNRAYGHIIRAFLNTSDKRVLDYRHARTLCREFGVNESYMIDGIGTPFGLEVNKAAAQAQVPHGNILFTTVQALAGSGGDIGSQNREDNEYFSLPGLHGPGLVAFPIEGRSMEPLINDSDVIICRQINSPREIKDNDLYAVKNNGSLWVKHVQRIADRRGNVRQLRLVSANHLEYEPFTEEVNEYTRLYKVLRRLSNM